MGLTGTLGATQAGLAAMVTGGAATFTVPFSKYDLNQDGVVNLSDVQLSAAQARGDTACTTGDVDGDGKCSVADVVWEVLAALGAI